jgi:uncharacterized membrane protein
VSLKFKILSKVYIYLIFDILYVGINTVCYGDVILYWSTVEILFFDEFQDVTVNFTVLTFIHPGWYLNFSTFMKNISFEEKKINV